MDSASDFGSEGCGFKSHLGHILCIFKDQKLKISMDFYTSEASKIQQKP